MTLGHLLLRTINHTISISNLDNKISCFTNFQSYVNKIHSFTIMLDIVTMVWKIRILQFSTWPRYVIKLFFDYFLSSTFKISLHIPVSNVNHDPRHDWVTEPSSQNGSFIVFNQYLRVPIKTKHTNLKTVYLNY